MTTIPVQRRFAAFMVTQRRDLAAFKDFTLFLKRGCENDDRGDPLSPQWQEVVGEYVDRARQITGNELDEREWKDVGWTLEQLHEADHVSLTATSLLEQAGDAYYRAGDYSGAIRTWERNGPPATEEDKYYWSKAACAKGLECIQWLDKVKNKTMADPRMAAEWDGLGRPNTPKEIGCVGPALERLHRDREAFKLYLQLHDITKARECLGRMIKTQAGSLEDVETLTNHLLETRQWHVAAEVVEREGPTLVGSKAEALRLRCGVVQELAYAQPATEELAPHRRQLEDFVDRVLSEAGWPSYMTMQEAGGALERTARLTTTLRFYEGYVDAPDPDLRQFARERWIATKRRHVELVRGERSASQAEHVYVDLSRQISNWDMRQNIELPAYPVMARSTKPDVPPAQSPDLWSVGKLRIEMNRSNGILLITNVGTLRAVRVDLRSLALEGEAEINRPNQDRLTFQVLASGYRGVVTRRAARTLVDLSFDDDSRRIQLEV